MNPVKAALHVAFLKKSVIGKKRRAPDHEQFDEQQVTPNLNGQTALHDTWCGSNYMKHTSSEKNHIQKSPLNNSSYAAGQESSIDIGGDVKSSTQVLPGQSLPHMCTALTSAIPLHEYIWQGDFEVNRNGDKVADMHPGFQAHLSTFVSPKVLEAVHKLSPRLSLTAVPRLSAWPAQFQETGASEDNIALYFFAKDIESYERYYKILLDNMMRNDLALKGFVNGVEILIFPSSQLPQKSRCWNMLFFMWGVFRAKKHDCENQMVGLSRDIDVSGKSCNDASPSIPVPPCPVPSTDSKKLDCEFIRNSISDSDGSSSCTRSPSKRSPPRSCEEERVVDMKCEVEPKHRFNGGTAVTDRPAMLGNKCTLLLTSSGSYVQGQELHSVDPERVTYTGNEEKEVAHRVTIEVKEKKDDGDIKPSLKKEPFMEVSTKDLEFGQHNIKNPCYGEIAKISCLDSNIDISKTQLTGLGFKDVKDLCSTSDICETGPTNSCKKILYDLNLDARDMMEESGTAEGSLSAVESPRVIDFRGAISTGLDLNSYANAVQIDGDSKDRQDPGFDLTSSVDTESFSRSNGALPQLDGMSEPFEGSAGKKEESPAASLSLSLALPFMNDKQQSSSKQANFSA